MTITRLIKSSALSLTLGLALFFPANTIAQETTPKVNTTKKPEAAAPSKGRGAEADPNRKPKIQPRSVRIAVAHPTRDTDRKQGKKQTWLGVAMAPVPEALREHLELSQGFGIHVQQVVGDSPAQKAGLRRNDILTQLDDQILTTPEHLSILIRSKKKGDEIELGLIRKGKPQTVKVVLGENEVPSGPSMRPHHSYRVPQDSGRGPHPPMPHMQSKEWQDAMKRHQQMWTKLHNQRFGQNRPQPKDNDKSSSCPLGAANCPKGANCPKTGNNSDCPKCKFRQQPDGKKPSCPDCKAKQPEAKKEDCQDCEKPKSGTPKAGKPPAISVRPGFPLKIFGTVGIVKIDNEEGALTLTQDGDNYAMVIKNKEGKEVFSGPYDTEKGVAGLPDEARAQLKKMKLADLDVILPKNALKINVSPEKKGSSSKRPDGIL